MISFFHAFSFHGETYLALCYNLLVTEQQVIPLSEIRNPNNSFFVYMPGLTGGGKSITSLREIPDLFVPSSISTPEARKKGEQNTSEHYANLAQEIAKRTQNQDLVLIGHSLGGYEILDLLEQLLKSPNFKSENINIAFLGVPGLTSRGLKGLAECGRRVMNVQKNVALNEQHIAYPLPDKFYETQKRNWEDLSNVVTVSKDTNEERQTRRVGFKNTIKDSSIPKGMTKESFFQRLDQLDKEIAGEAVPSQPQEKLLAERAKLLYAGIQGLFRGDSLENTKYEQFLVMYKERLKDLSKSVSYQINALLYYARAGKSIVQGTGERLKRILESAKKQGKNIDVSFVIMERDEIIPPEDIKRLRRRLSEANIDQTSVVFSYMEQVAHSSFGYDTKSLQDYIHILKQRAEVR